MPIGDFLTSGNAIYYGTERDTKRSFELKHKNYPIFKRFFDASDSSIVSIASSTIKIQNHFFVTGEKVEYSLGVSTNSPIGIGTTDFGSGIGITDKLPSFVYIIKVDDNNIKLARNAQDALKTVPVPLKISSVGIGSSHSFTSINQNSKVMIAIDKVIQSPVVSTATTTNLSLKFSEADDVLYSNSVLNLFIGDYIEINDEIMKIESVGVGSTNSIRVLRPLVGTKLQTHSIGSTITKFSGNYNIVENAIHFVESPYGNVPLSTNTNPPDERDWVGISTGSSFQGRVFMRSGVTDSSNEAYYKNYTFDDISFEFNGTKNSFTLKSNQSNVKDVYQDNGVILINDIFQGPGLQNDYTMDEVSGITSVSFTGSATANTSDINTSNLPSGGIIVSVGSTEGFGYQSLVLAGGTVVVSSAGTIASVSIANTGSGYRASSQYEILSDVSSTVGVGSTSIFVENQNSIFNLINALNTGSNCKIGVGTFIKDAVITSLGSTFINIGAANTSAYSIPTGSQVVVKINNPQIGIARVGVATSSVENSSITHIGFTTIKNGHISTSVTITNAGYGFTSTNPPYLIIDDPLPYTDLPLIYSSTSSGIGTEATIDVVVGQGSSIIDFEVKNIGYGYKPGDVLTVPIGGIVGIPTNPSLTFKEFKIFVDKTFTDKFSGWSLGELYPLDNIQGLFNGRRIIFPLLEFGELISIYSKKGSQLDIQNNLLVFINDILQIPGEGYIFNGGSRIQFTEAPKPEDTCKILFYRGSGLDVDVIFRNVLETVKSGDDLKLTYDPSIGQPSYLLEDPRFVTDILSIDSVETNTYFGPGNTSDEKLTRPITWCRQTEDLIINDQEVAKNRKLYEPQIYPSSYLIQSVGIGSSVVFVDNIRPFFNPINENSVSLEFQKNVTFVSQDTKVSASATAVVSVAGTISSIIINDGGFGYKQNPSVTIQSPSGIATITSTAVASISSGIVTSISITGVVTEYSQENPPTILIEPPGFDTESNKVISYSGDFGFISGISTVSVGVASTGIVFDFVIPQNSYLRNGLVSGISTISGIQTGYYFIVSNSNVGNGVTSLDSNGSTIGITTTYLDNVYQAASVSIAQTSVIGLGITYVTRVTVSVSDYNGLSGIGYSSYYGDYSWGRIVLRSRSKENSYNAYTSNGYVGISTGTIVKRTVPLKYVGYLTSLQ